MVSDNLSHELQLQSRAAAAAVRAIGPAPMSKWAGARGRDLCLLR